MGNTGQSSRSVADTSSDYAQAFTTGSGTGGCQLSGVILVMTGRGDTAPTYSVSIRSNSSANRPDTTLGTLADPANLPDANLGDEVQFTVSGAIDLTAHTTYWVVVEWSAAGDPGTLEL